MDPAFSETNVVMIYVLGAAIAGLRLGRGPGTLTAVASVRGLRLLLRAAAVHVPGQRRAVRGHVPRHAGRDAHDRQPDGERAAAEPRRRRARATHGTAVCDEPRTGRHARQRQHGARGGPARRRGLRLPAPSCCTPDCIRAPAVSAGSSVERLVPGRGSLGRAVGLRSRPARRSRHRHAARRARRLPAAARRAARSACSRCCRRTGGASCCPSSGTCSRRSPDRLRSPGNESRWARRQRGRASRRRARACATRCSRRSRTTCARRCR